MIVRYKDRKLEKVCTEYKEAKRKFGIYMADEIMECIKYLESADSVEILIALGFHRCHPLTNNRDTQYALDLRHPYRLIFVKNPDDGSVHVVKIIEIVDYH